MKDIPAGSVVVGNPGRIVESNIKTARWGNRAEVAESAEQAIDEISSGTNR